MIDQNQPAPPSRPFPGHLAVEATLRDTDLVGHVNNGVYRCGFAGTQEAYDEAFDSLFRSLDGLERRLASSRYLVGDALTGADWRLFTTLVRFDAAVPHADHPPGGLHDHRVVGGEQEGDAVLGVESRLFVPPAIGLAHRPLLGPRCALFDRLPQGSGGIGFQCGLPRSATTCRNTQFGACPMRRSLITSRSSISGRG